MFTTADLPLDMQYRPEDETTRAVRGSGLTIECVHGDDTCPRCIAAAARAIAAADGLTSGSLADPSA